jgi:transcriptional regulator with XRE-family HTH domain
MEINFGKNLKNLRKAQKLTLIQLAKQINISKSALSDYETGKSVPSMDVVLKISNYFEVNVEKLYNSEKMENDFNDDSEQKTKDPLKAAFENEKYSLHLKLMNQKVESIQLQLQLLRQVLESKDAENKTLKINIQLLEQRISLLSLV